VSFFVPVNNIVPLNGAFKVIVFFRVVIKAKLRQKRTNKMRENIGANGKMPEIYGMNYLIFGQNFINSFGPSFGLIRDIF